MDKLEKIDRPPNALSRLQHVAYITFNPISAFMSTENALKEQDLREVLLAAASRIAVGLEPRITEAHNLYDLFKMIQAKLDRISALTHSEKNDRPNMGTLASLWSQLARANEYAEYKSHAELLENLDVFYKSMGQEIGDVLSALKRISSELKQFREGFASAPLALRDDSLKVIMRTLRQAGQRLEAGKRKLEGI